VCVRLCVFVFMCVCVLLNVSVFSMSYRARSSGRGHTDLLVFMYVRHCQPVVVSRNL
jgi:hypothetical protein